MANISFITTFIFDDVWLMKVDASDRFATAWVWNVIQNFSM